MRIFIECENIDEKHIEFLSNEKAIDLEDFVILKSSHKRLLLYTVLSEDDLYYHFTNGLPTHTDETEYCSNSDEFVERIQQLKLLRLLS